MKIIRHHWHYIQNDPAVGKFFQNYPIMAFKKNKNLKTYLVRAKIKPPSNSYLSQNSPAIRLELEHQPVSDSLDINPFHRAPDTMTPCPIRSCFLHKYLEKSLRVQSTVTTRSFRVRGNLNCNSNNIIYLIQCKKCKKQYVGQTITSLRHRISQHNNNKQISNSTVEQHFCLPDHIMEVQPIEQISISHTDSPNT